MLREKIRKLVPSKMLPIARRLNYFTNEAYIIDRKSIVLNSIPKSGTMYMRIIMANYINIVYGNGDPVTYDETQLLYPNVRDHIIMGRQKYFKQPFAHPIYKAGYSDFIYGHSVSGLEFVKHGSIVHLYRNPLDNIVSRFFYTWKNRPGRETVYENPSEVIDLVLTPFIEQYNRIKLVKNILRIPYELLISDTFNVIFIVLGYLNLEIDVNGIVQAIENSSMKEIKKQEEQRGFPIHSPVGQSGSFVRSGKVGQWKQFFSDKEIDYVKNRLVESGIKIDEFVWIL